MRLSGRREQIKIAARALIGQHGEVPMNISVTQFVVASAMVGRNRTVWRQIVDTVIEGPPRTTADEIAGYLARHPHDLSPALRVELERRHMCV
jgi:hypothetical protein